MWHRIKDRAKGLQQRAQADGAPAPTDGRAAGSGTGSKAQLVGMLKSQLTSVKTELESGSYGDAGMAMCALVAPLTGRSTRPSGSSGVTDPAERCLQYFPPEQLRQRFNKHVDQLTFNFQQGKTGAMQVIVQAAKKQTEAKAVVQTGFVVAGADGYVVAGGREFDDRT